MRFDVFWSVYWWFVMIWSVVMCLEMFLICFDHHSKIRCISELTVLRASWKASLCCRDNLSIASANSNVCCLLKRSGDAFLTESLAFFSWRPDALEFVRSKVRAPRTFLRRSSTSWRRSLGPYLPWSGSTQTWLGAKLPNSRVGWVRWVLT